MMSFVIYLKNVVQLNRSLFEIFDLKHVGIYSEWRAQMDSQKYPLDLQLPWISVIAKNYIENFLSKRPSPDIKVFEYGSGGSSLFFLKYASRVISVEHDTQWFELVRNRVMEKALPGWEGLLIKPELMQEGFKEIPDKGNPLDYYSDDVKFAQYRWQAYASSIDQYSDEYFDIVMVDGRSRPSCLYHGAKKVKKDGLLILDNAERPYYLSSGTIRKEDFKLVCSSNGVAICSPQFTQTNVYIKR
jgi:hypothetical protein